ncbi:CRISPR-associated protein Cmr4 [Desulfonauticus submarinus]|uniref:CRISPR-associated protein Cmr4 n=1 Tax=Desulfonauticus submarinus TaxID=206665 RepID=A0A1H0DNU6_9BACT|nr:type III-B CRISPR module RAMP protein Cmr4 [Desulfonauticus submarinus]SDN71749.1 CRISPR-associated protein Cmr4 [Desulfonauticus submarinus]
MADTFLPFKTKKYLAIAKEPVYVGTGGYRIGRVDNTIVRDPATNLPKIPGSTISGNARYYSWLAYKSEGMNLNLGCSKGKKTNDENACGACPVCLSYGFINDKSAQSGLAYFSDARILFFPVSTMIGTVWVTSDEIVKEFIDTIGSNGIEITENQFICSNKMTELPKSNEMKEILNFGWIMLEKKENKDISGWKLKGDNNSEEVSNLKDVFDEIKNKVCVVSTKVFHHIVNSNLETRTSVSINPVTGAAEGGALFTYEALPRGTVFILDVTYENPKNYGKDNPMEEVIGTVEKGFELFSSLGIGGMGTRGFGKIEIKKDKFLSEKDYWESVKEYLKKLQQKSSNLKDKINKQIGEIKTGVNGDTKEKENDIKKDCKKLDALVCVLKLWKVHLESQKEILKKKIDTFEEISSTISSITIEIPEGCREEESNEQ